MFAFVSRSTSKYDVDHNRDIIPLMVATAKEMQKLHQIIGLFKKNLDGLGLHPFAMTISLIIIIKAKFRA